MLDLDKTYLEEFEKIKKEHPNAPIVVMDFLQALIDQINKNWKDVQELLKEKEQ